MAVYSADTTPADDSGSPTLVVRERFTHFAPAVDAGGGGTTAIGCAVGKFGGVETFGPRCPLVASLAVTIF
jgi:hypothetical protein